MSQAGQQKIEKNVPVPANKKFKQMSHNRPSKINNYMTHVTYHLMVGGRTERSEVRPTTKDCG